MTKLTTRQLGLVAFFVYFLTRAFILLHEPAMSDVHLYYELAKRSSWGALEVYKDYPFAYPFLSWFAVAWPTLLDGQMTFEAYQVSLHAFFFALELGTIGFLFYRFKTEESWLRLIARALLIYSLLSGLQFDLIFDRVDLMMTLSLIAVFIFWESFVGIAFVFGFLIKLVPIALWPLKFLQLWRADRKRALISIWMPVVAIALLVASDFLFFPGELAALSHHSSRGIQLESLWATPFLLLHILGLDPSAVIANVFGAQEVHSDLIADWLLTVARYVGFVIIIALYFFGRIEMKTLPGRARGFLIFIFAFLCFQRVLSTQFILWAAPFLAISLALRFDRLVFALSLVAFALTAVVFDPGYWDVVHFDPFFTVLLATRNCILLALFGLSLRTPRIM